MLGKLSGALSMADSSPTLIPTMPPHCHRESLWAFALSLVPAIAVILALISGHYGIAGFIFGSTFTIISIGAIVPRCSLFGPLITKLPTEAKGVCLTIDDGPDPITTPALLDLLDEHQAKAVFFLIGDRAARHPGLVREIARRGHIIGNHSQTHPAGKFWMLRPWALWAEVAGCQETLRSILGQAPVWFRPPVGHHNLFLASILRALGLKMMIWNCRGFDGVQRDVPSILRSIERGLRPGAIILLHEARPVSADVLRGTLERVARKEFSIVLPELL
jgi:peptidoglycan-N-acetylglucosamine deacetylase